MNEKLRILHAPVDMAGQAGMISRAQKKMGFKSDLLVYQKNRYNYQYDIDADLRRWPYALWPLIKLRWFLFCLPRYDVFHFHFGESLLPKNIDIPILRFLGKKVVMEYWGADVQQGDILKQYSDYSDELIKQRFPPESDEKKRRMIKRISRYANASIVADYALLPYAPDSAVVRQAYDYAKAVLSSSDDIGDQDIIKIVHAPSDRAFKGTDEIIRVIERLKDDGLRFKFILVENMDHESAMKIYRDADILINEIKMGPYGILAIEAMALGKPVLSRLDPKLIDYYPGLPIVNATSETLYDNLKMLISDSALRQELGRRGREYVKENHDAERIAKRFIEIYNKAN